MRVLYICIGENQYDILTLIDFVTLQYCLLEKR